MSIYYYLYVTNVPKPNEQHDFGTFIIKREQIQLSDFYHIVVHQSGMFVLIFLCQGQEAVFT